MIANIPPDQIQFVIAQLGAVSFAILYRQLCKINKKSPESNNSDRSTPENDGYSDQELNIIDSRTNNLLVLSAPGLLISYLCYGHLVIHLVILSFICYLVFLLVSPRYVHIVTLIVALLHLSYLHLDRLFNEFSVSAVDITA